MFKEVAEIGIPVEKVSVKKYTNNILPFQQMLTEKIEIPPQIIENGILLQNALLLISGKFKVRKTFLTQNLAIALATGRSFAIFKVNKSHKVLLLSAEGGIVPNFLRMEQMCQSARVEKIDNLFVCMDTRWQFDNDADLETMKAKIDEIKPDVVIFDPFGKFHHHDENSAQEMTGIFGTIRNLIEDYNISVILVHHIGKNEIAGPRGSSIIGGEYDSHISIKGGKSEQNIEFNMRHVEPPEPDKLRFNPTTLWFESDEDQVIAVQKRLGKVSRRDFADELVKSGKYQSPSGAYGVISKYLKDGLLRMDEKGMIS